MGALRVASRLAASWIAKLREAQTLLRDEPTHWNAWHWQIQAKVLTYLILRYGGDPLLDLRSRVSAVPLPQAEIPQTPPRGPYIRKRAELRRLLEEIAEINRFKLI